MPPPLPQLNSLSSFMAVTPSSCLQMGLPLSHTWKGEAVLPGRFIVRSPVARHDAPTFACRAHANDHGPAGEGFTAIAQKNDMVLDQLLAWNRYADSTSCSGLWANAYACISVVGHITPSSPPNGVQTPAPIQDGMVGTCKTFHFVEENQTCRIVAALYKVSEGDFVKWNPAVGSDCRGIMFAWSNTNYFWSSKLLNG
ncbi:hypothetical protein PG984_011862 [Apiospora sp. TS-2023a]